MRILTAVVLGLGLAFSLPAGAAEKSSAKKATPARAASATAKTPAKAPAKAKSKSSAKAKAKKPATTRYAQQHPSPERYTEIQQALVERGYLPAATGAWGVESVAALKKFQQEQGLHADGKLGALSLTALGLGPRRGGSVSDAITAGVLPSGSAPVPLD